MNLARAILNELKTLREPLLESETMIHVSVNVLVPEPVTLEEVRAELGRLERDGFVKGIHDKIDRVTRWKLTNEGRLA